ncbi:MAG TPA: hypothetical protein VFT87_03335, partial [Candidatus Saccharimonadales bacterium]|nr:hypothetical protein [Candidatus Saccharimonadales bacterium]
MDQEEIWREAIERVKNLTDTLGMPVDPEITEAVAVLQLLGLKTTMSCAGHVDRITGGPYIICVSPSAKAILKSYKGSFDPKEKTYKKTMQKVTRATLVERAKLYRFLESFYSTRLVAYDQRLYLTAVGRDSFRLSCQGAEQAYLRNKQSQEHLL